MSDDTESTPAAANDDVVVVGGAVSDEYGILAEGAVAVQGNHALVVARFADTTSARAVYDDLLSAEIDGSLHIDSVLVVKADDNGKLHVEKMTDHSTRTGLKWGIVGGVVAAVFLPATIVAGAVTLGVAGAAAGKARNLAHRLDVEKELADVILPGTSGILALVTAEDAPAVEAKASSAQEVKVVSVDDETAEAVKEAAATVEADDTVRQLGPRRAPDARDHAESPGRSRSGLSIRVGGRRLVRFGGPSPPRRHAVHLDVQREAQEGPDQDDQPERRRALERLVDGDGQDDVGDDQDLEPEQDGAPQVVAQGGVGDPPVALDEVVDVDDKADEGTEQQDDDAGDLERVLRDIEDLFEFHGSIVAHSPVGRHPSLTLRPLIPII